MISWLRFSKEPLDVKHKERALRALIELRDEIQPMVIRAEPQAIIKTIELLATTFQVALPDEDGLLIYAAVLSELSDPLLKKAVVEVCKTHKYKTLPLPAEILEPVKDEAWQWRWFDATLTRLIAKVEDIKQLPA